MIPKTSKILYFRNINSGLFFIAPLSVLIRKGIIQSSEYLKSTKEEYENFVL